MGAPTGPDTPTAAELARLLTAVGQVPPLHLPLDGGLAFLDEAALGFVMLHRDDTELVAAHRRFSTARLALHRAQVDRQGQALQETATAAAQLADLLSAFGDERVVRCTRPTVPSRECSAPLAPVTGRCTAPLPNRHRGTPNTGDARTLRPGQA
ncbi:hypothetical protein FE391_43490 [Nonomuraea sp. KC401]|uniref:hypothetical protein n=1 Tax=unclassified Nonomuraea TaxID=2593643 RepID=UPI0010FE2331|nr:MULTISPECIES: hypothetical protein [unclassified Nonomuraea]NBF00224.1 hypothetical protein [Nonomuraea sp. K271]TLF52457.1 hypothetical protein FE391_43490 [Nonomuraea sp. KC401]